MKEVNGVNKPRDFSFEKLPGFRLIKRPYRGSFSSGVFFELFGKGAFLGAVFVEIVGVTGFFLIEDTAFMMSSIS